MLYIFEDADKIDDDIPESMISLLSGDRCAKMRRLRSSLSKKASVAAYLLLRVALVEIYSIDEAVEFEYAEKGKPLLKDYPDIHFSLSHSKSTVACAVSDVEVGVDVQNISPISDRLAKRVLTEFEYARFKESPAPDEYFCEIWTIKESYLKKTGQGIRFDLRELSADSVSDRTVYRGEDYFCCVTGSDTQVRVVGREEFERLHK